MQALKFFTGKKMFDIVFLDPPYAGDLGDKALQYILENNLLKKDGLIIFEHSCEKCLQSDNDLYIITRSKKYGDKVIDFITAK